MTHPIDALAEYVAGASAPETTGAVARHLAGCVRCRAEEAAWRRLATAVQAEARATPAPGAAVLHAVRRRVAGAARAEPPVLPRYIPSPTSRRTSRCAPTVRALTLLCRQARLVGWPVWALSALAITAGAVLAAVAPTARAGELLGLVVPPVAAFAVAATCSYDGPVDELVRATPTSARVVMLARLTLILAGALVAGTAASAVLASLGGGATLAALVWAWLGPLVPLSAVSFAVSVLWRPGGGTGVAMTLWLLRLLSGSTAVNHWVGAVAAVLWAPGGPVLLAAGVLILTAAVAGPAADRRRMVAARP